jgi:hypothetical protein
VEIRKLAQKKKRISHIKRYLILDLSFLQNTQTLSLSPCSFPSVALLHILGFSKLKKRFSLSHALGMQMSGEESSSTKENKEVSFCSPNVTNTKDIPYGTVQKAEHLVV